MTWLEGSLDFGGFGKIGYGYGCILWYSKSIVYCHCSFPCWYSSTLGRNALHKKIRYSLNRTYSELVFSGHLNVNKRGRKILVNALQRGCVPSVLLWKGGLNFSNCVIISR